MAQSNRPTPLRLLLVASGFALVFALQSTAASWVRTLKPAGYGTGIGVAPHKDGAVVAWSDATARSLRMVTIDSSGNVKSAHDFKGGWSQLYSVAATPDGGLAMGFATPMELQRGSLPPVMLLNGGMLQLSSALDRVGSRMLAPAPNVAEQDRLAGTRVRAACLTPDGDLFLVADLGPDKSMLMHLDPNVDTPWMKTLDWPGAQELRAIAPSGEGVIVAGTVAGQAIVARFDETGKVSWQRLLGPGIVTSLAPGSDGSMLAAGSAVGAGHDILVAKLSSEGAPLWANTFGSSYDEGATSVHLSKRGTILVGAMQQTSEGSGMLAVELGPDGSLALGLALASSAPGEASVASGSDAAGELVLALHSQAGVTVARYDGASPPMDCARDAQLAAAPARTAGAELPLQAEDVLFYPGPPRPDTTQIVDVASAAASCRVAAPAAVAGPAGLSDAEKQQLDIAAFRNQLRELLRARKFDELESTAARLRVSLETLPTGDFRIREFYEAFAPFCADDCNALNALLEEWKHVKPDSPTPRIAIALAADHALNARSKEPGLWMKAVTEISSVPPGFADPEFQKFRISTAGSDEEGWAAFEQASKAFPDFYNIYNTALSSLGGTRESRERIVERGVSLSRARLGESILARAASFVQVTSRDVGWVALQWPRVQAGYHDLFKAHPASYKNMVRFALLACDVRDTRVASSIVTHLGENSEAAVRMANPDPAWWSWCTSLATFPRFEPWVDGPPLEFGKISSLKAAAVAIPEGLDQQTEWMLSRMSWWVAADRSNWPRLVLSRDDAARAGLGGAETGFFAKGGDGATRYVTASPFGFNAIGSVTVKSAAGGERIVVPEASDYEAITRSATFRLDAPGVKVLATSARTPAPGDRVFIPTPGPKGQTVLVGMLRDVALEKKKYPLTFKLVLPLGSDAPTPGSPVLDEHGWLLGVVTKASVTNGVTDIECEGAQLLLHRRPPR